MSARIKLMLSIGALITTIIVVLSSLGYYQIDESSTRDYRSKLSNKSFLISKAIEGKVEGYFGALESVRTALSVEQGEVVINDKVIEQLVKSKERMQVLNFFIGLPTGVTYAAATNGLIPNFNAKEKKREWFLSGMTGAPRTVTNPFMATTGDLTMAIVVPMKQNGQVIAVIGMSLKMSDITEYVNQLSPEKNIFVAREDGFLVAAAYADYVGKNLFELRPSYRKYANETTSEHSYSTPDKGDFFVVQQKIASLGWTVWAWAKQTDIDATSNTAVKTNAIAGIFFILIGAAGVYVLITKLMYVPIGGEPKEIEILVDRIASGDLTHIPTLDDKSSGVYRSTVTMANSLKRIISDINESSTQLTQVSSQLGESSDKVDTSSQSQMAQLEQVATAMNEMTATVAEVAQNAVEASSSSDGASQSAQVGLGVVGQMNQEITKLVDDIGQVQEVISNVHTETENVGGILDVIRGIADQTNLLALNAAIEAARAGEHGRGFAVVADEVRTLATKTQESTNEIQSMIEELQAQASRSVGLMTENANSAGQTLDKSAEASNAIEQIDQEIRTIQDMNNQIATAAEEQSSVAAEINENVVSVNDLAASTAEDVQENVRTASDLNAMANRLRDAISMFKV
ncbi:methyl-accepting chemotaxis protein [Shewanella gelidii]|uniref:Methyl-accepting chemotaxis protein n=1 Tax=Shewanella gelidii TaxID=1642821 RepID=A0A917JST6_9GAMM|nr:methyl-accepting chemotaxis protein [Shewanella gelidii]MCL1098509.1 methyl-accepting chemotaxis protein [Shewanella gelidii]GGI82181.1 methyl-accepting chemotaxis protein [Shewanella gelidii]